MTRVLLISLVIAIATAVFFKVQSDKRLQRLTDAQNQVIALQTAVNEQEKVIETYAEAEKQAKEFEKELNDDYTDNLDVIPADYILKQLHAD
jgi:uncharacterized protein HemX